MRTDWKLAVGTFAVAGALAVPASASAAITLATPLAPCYEAIGDDGVPSIALTLTGGTPGDSFQVVATYPDDPSEVGSAGSADGTTAFDANGDGIATLTSIFPEGNPTGPLAGRPVDLSVEDFNANDGPTGYTTTPIANVLITNLGMSVAESPESPRKAREVAVSATAFAHQKLYGFITSPKGKVYSHFYLGTGNVCGYVRHKAVVDSPREKQGDYRLYINAGSKLDKARAIYEPFKIYYHAF